ncbi:MAG: ExbD/TolR family protein [Phycisphaerae bacterium]
MSRFRDSADDDLGATGIDISPLMDCVFILLIFFIVTTTFVEETGVEVEKPAAAAGESLEKNSILIAVTQGGEVVYAGKKIGVGGVRQVVQQQLEGNPEMPVIIQSDKSAQHGLAMQVFGQAKTAGALKVSFAVQEE